MGEHEAGCPEAGRRRAWLGAAWEACAGCEEALRADNARLRAALGAKELEAARARAGDAVDWRETSESWRRAAVAWQEWARGWLGRLGPQPEGGELGDGPARERLGEALGGEGGR